MLLFVIAALTIFHFALPRRARATSAARRPALVGDRLHRAARADARVRRRARAGDVRRARARAVRPQRDLARRRRSRCSRSSALAELVALPAFALFFHGARRPDGRRGRARRRRHLRRRDALRRDGGRRPGPRAAPAAALPAAGDPDRRRVGAASRRQYLWFLALYDAIFVLLSWATFEYVVAGDLMSGSRTTMPAVKRTAPDDCPLSRARAGLFALAIALIFFYAPDRRRPGLLAADLLLPRADRPHRRTRASAGAPGRRCATSGSATSAPTSRATSRSTRA